MIHNIRYERWSHCRGTKEYEVAIVGIDGQYILVRRWGAVGRQHSSKIKSFKTLSHVNGYLGKIRTDKCRAETEAGKGGYSVEATKTADGANLAMGEEITDGLDNDMLIMINELPASLISAAGTANQPSMAPTPSPQAPTPPAPKPEKPSHYGTW